MNGNHGGTVVKQSTAELTLGDADPTIANLEDIYLDGTLVLIAEGEERRSPDDEFDLATASVGPREQLRQHGPHGPAWEAGEMFPDASFDARKEFARTVTQWTGDDRGWAILSSEHGVVEPWEPVQPYGTTVDDLGGDEREASHRVENSFQLRRPDGREIVTEMDSWAATVASTLMRWVASYRDAHDKPWENEASTLLILAPEDYLNPLRERGVFEYGIARMSGNPNQGYKQPLRPEYLYESLATDDESERLAWLSDAVERLPDYQTTDGNQAEFGRWTGSERSCNRCGRAARDGQLEEIGGEVVCSDCQPERCTRCEEWTHQTGIGAYPLCGDCQTATGGMTNEPLTEPTSEQTELGQTANGGDSR
jgi:hypothetical protein